jgi:hypothetical protein
MEKQNVIGVTDLNVTSSNVMNSDICSISRNQDTSCNTIQCKCGRYSCFHRPVLGCSYPECEWYFCCDKHIYAYCGWKGFCKFHWDTSVEHHSHIYWLNGHDSAIDGSQNNFCPHQNFKTI